MAVGDFPLEPYSPTALQLSTLTALHPYSFTALLYNHPNVHNNRRP